ncbi:MAG: hypothetical protein LBG58_09775 [Planctomycetaceae bacterium]|nr:hypothetical protein [Planctomycetaceae bacterium]
MTTLVEKFNLNWITPESIEKTREQLVKIKESKFVDDFYRTDSFVSKTSDLLTQLYLIGRDTETKTELLNFPSVVENKFFGDWQKTCLYDGVIAPNKWHGILSWYDDIRALCMWCSAMSDWKNISKCLRFFDEEVEEGKAGNMGRAFYIALRYHFEECFDKRDSYFENILSGRSKKYREIVETFKAIIGDNAESVLKGWSSVFKLWKQKESGVYLLLAPESTFLYYFAEKNGISIPLKDDQYDHIIHFTKK